MCTQGCKEKADFAWKSLENVQGLIRLADAKAGALIAIWVLMIGSLASSLADSLPRAYIIREGSYLARSLFFCVGLFALLALAVLFYVGSVYRPRRAPRAAQPGLVYWDDILEHKTADEFCRAMVRSEEQLLLGSLTEQVFVCSRILSLKLYWLDKAFTIGFIMAAAWMGSMTVSVMVNSWR